MKSTTFVGNLGADPKFYPAEGKKDARALLRVALEQPYNMQEGRRGDKTEWLTVTAFGVLAEHVAETLSKGDRVIGTGTLNVRQVEVEIDGEERQVDLVQVRAQAIGPELRFATATVSKASKSSYVADEDDEEDEVEEVEEAPKPKARPATKKRSTASGARTKTSARPKAKASAAAADDDDW